MADKWYQPQEFAKLVGLTKRALRYYKERKLLLPDYVNEDGFGYYSEKNLFEAQQIVALRYLNLSVDEIKEIQLRKMDLPSSLELQKQLLKEKILEMQNLTTAIDAVQRQLIDQPSHVDWNNIFETVKFSKYASVEKSMIAYYDERASEYEDIYVGGGPASCKPDVYKHDVKGLQTFIQSYGKGNMIDIGCGTGYWIKDYYKNCDNFTFIDISPHMLLQCRQKATTYHLEARCTWIQKDFLQWKEYQPHSYDCALIGFLLGHYMTIQENLFFDQLRTIIKPGGQILIIENTWTKKRKEEHKEDIQIRELSDGCTFPIYKKYFEQDEISRILEKHNIKVDRFYWGLNFFGVIGEIN